MQRKVRFIQAASCIVPSRCRIARLGFVALSAALLARTATADVSPCVPVQDDIVAFDNIAGVWQLSRAEAGPPYIDGSLDSSLGIPFGSDPNAVALVGDVNGDGAADIVYTLSDGDPNNTGIESVRWVAGHTAVDAFGLGTLSDLSLSTIPASFALDDTLARLIGDVNGDGAADAIIVSNSYLWASGHSVPGVGLDLTTISVLQYGIAGDVPLVGDFNGDGFFDACAFRAGTWNVALSDANGLSDANLVSGGFGAAGDIPFAADMNGDGRDDGILCRDNGGGMIWYVAYSDASGVVGGAGTASLGGFGSFTLGDEPFVADVDGDGLADRVVVRPGAPNTIYVEFTGGGGGDSALFGTSGDATLFANLDDPATSGDFAADIVTYDAAAGAWQHARTAPAPDYLVGIATSALGGAFGAEPTTIGIVGDVNGDGQDDILAVRENGPNSTLVWEAAHSDVDPMTGRGVLSVAESSALPSWGFDGLAVHVDLLDSNGDGYDDVLYVYREPTGGLTWIAGQSTAAGIDNTTTTAIGFGTLTLNDLPLTGDFDGDGIDDACVYRGGVWAVAKSDSAGLSSANQVSAGFGAVGDIPLVADVNGDGRDDGIIVRDDGEAGYRWFVGYSNSNGEVAGDGTPPSVSFGNSTDGDIPVVADVNGDGQADIGIVRPDSPIVGEATWFFSLTVGGVPDGGDAEVSAIFGNATDQYLVGNFDPIVIAGDGNGDGVVDFADLAVFESCFDGPDVLTGAACLPFDYDCDGDNDLADSAALQLAVSP